MSITVSCGYEDATLIVEDFESGEVRFTTQVDASNVNGLHVNPDNTLVAIAAEAPHAVHVFNLVVNDLECVLQPFHAPPNRVLFAHSSHLLFCSDSSGSIHMYNTIDWSLLQSLQVHAAGIYGLSLTSDDGKLVSGSYDGKAIVRRLTDGEHEDPVVLQHPYGVSQAVFLSDNSTVVTCSSNSIATLWNGDSGDLLRRVPLTGMFGLFSHPNKNLFVTSGLFGKICVWNSDFSLERVIQCDKDFMSLSMWGDVVVAGISNGNVTAYDVETGQQVRTFAHHRGMVFAMTCSSSDDAPRLNLSLFMIVLAD